MLSVWGNRLPAARSKSCARAVHTRNHDGPSRCDVVGQTWRYVNKQGGPDRRFSNNPQLPVLETRDLSLADCGGFRAVLKFSNVSAAEQLRDALVNFTIGHPQTVAPNGTAARSALPLASPKQSKRSWLPATIVTVLLSAAATIAVLFYPHPLEQSTASTKPVPATPLPADKPEVVLASTCMQLNLDRSQMNEHGRQASGLQATKDHCPILYPRIAFLRSFQYSACPAEPFGLLRF